MRQIDVAVIGAGQAGLATSYELSARHIDHVVLERDRIAESWRSRRWDSFALNIPNWSFNLPGHRYDGSDPDGFMLRDEIVERFEAYADAIGAPVEEGVEVLRLAREPDGRYRLDTTDGELMVRAVVVATGAYQRRHRPQNSLDPSILQLDTDTFRNAGELYDGGVLIVGSGQSGCQIAEDLRQDGRSVWLATGSCGWMPRRYRGRDNVAWRLEMGVFDESVANLGHAMRLACPPIQTGVDGGRDLNLRTLAEAGVTLTGRLLGADGRRVQLADDLEANARRSDEAAVRFTTMVDDYVRDRAPDTAAGDPFQPVGELPDAPTEFDLAALGITNVIWASGFRLDFSWIALDLDPRDGYPEQVQGVSRHPGLYFMGLQLMHTRKSGLIFGVGEDAAHVASVAAQHLGAA
ncbi:MAG: FAD-dependent oxidoreductase [Chloroflexota bacterium]